MSIKEYLKQFDRAAIEEFTKTVKRKRGWDDNHSSEDVLEFMQLGRREGKRFVANYACALVFALNPRTVCPGCRIRFLRFDGEGTGESWNAVKDEFVDGPIPILLKGAEVLVTSQFRRSFSIKPAPAS